jgi:hypothetical protein
MSQSFSTTTPTSPAGPTPLTSPSEEALRQVTDAADQGWLEAQKCIEERPVESLIAAFFGGLLLGLIFGGGKCRKG